jgi:hypothetical protein
VLSWWLATRFHCQIAKNTRVSDASFEAKSHVFEFTLWTFAKSNFRVNFELIFAVSPVELITSLTCFVIPCLGEVAFTEAATS